VPLNDSALDGSRQVWTEGASSTCSSTSNERALHDDHKVWGASGVRRAAAPADPRPATQYASFLVNAAARCTRCSRSWGTPTRRSRSGMRICRRKPPEGRQLRVYRHRAGCGGDSPRTACGRAYGSGAFELRAGFYN
jgi:hypothetical protein